MNSRLFTVVSGDMVQSRKMSQRNAFSHELNETLQTINEIFQEEMFAPLTVTKGIDEISGVLKRPDLSYMVCRTLNNRVYPHFFRFAIVTDILDVAITTHDARQIDGKAFHTASNLLLSGKKRNSPYCFRVCAKKELDSLVEDLAHLVHIARMSWTPKQYRMIQLYEEFKNQADVAKKLEITQQAVSDSLQSSHFEDVKRSEESIDAVLKTTLVYKPKGLSGSNPAREENEPI